MEPVLIEILESMLGKLHMKCARLACKISELQVHLDAEKKERAKLESILASKEEVNENG